MNVAKAVAKAEQLAARKSAMETCLHMADFTDSTGHHVRRQSARCKVNRPSNGRKSEDDDCQLPPRLQPRHWTAKLKRLSHSLPSPGSLVNARPKCRLHSRPVGSNCPPNLSRHNNPAGITPREVTVKNAHAHRATNAADIRIGVRGGGGFVPLPSTPLNPFIAVIKVSPHGY